MKKILLSLALVFTLMLVITGCGKKEGLVGSWEHETFKGYVYTFNEDKTCKYDAYGTIMNCTYEVDGDKLSILYTGNTAPFETTYKIEGDTLTIKDSLDSDVVYKRK